MDGVQIGIHTSWYDNDVTVLLSYFCGWFDASFIWFPFYITYYVYFISTVNLVNKKLKQIWYPLSQQLKMRKTVFCKQPTFFIWSDTPKVVIQFSLEAIYILYVNNTVGQTIPLISDSIIETKIKP